MKLSELVQKGWTYAAIADALGVSQRTVARWHHGTQAPGLTGPVLKVLATLDTLPVPKQRRRQ